MLDVFLFVIYYFNSKVHDDFIRKRCLVAIILAKVCANDDVIRFFLRRLNIP